LFSISFWEWSSPAKEILLMIRMNYSDDIVPSFQISRNLEYR